MTDKHAQVEHQGPNIRNAERGQALGFGARIRSFIRHTIHKPALPSLSQADPLEVSSKECASMKDKRKKRPAIVTRNSIDIAKVRAFKGLTPWEIQEGASSRGDNSESDTISLYSSPGVVSANLSPEIAERHGRPTSISSVRFKERKKRHQLSDSDRASYDAESVATLMYKHASNESLLPGPKTSLINHGQATAREVEDKTSTMPHGLRLTAQSVQIVSISSLALDLQSQIDGASAKSLL